ncbi:TetR/AcrR family transcriptional regulator [Antrihabitans sp. YC2-6]|uniref:TetR/AcrR family transcriptional regulator n=1 Tax=Antrihabitans sp. YC2-6 TaxID=2799498 RepID=UPI0018F61D9B|nr:TetR/AcrR family transcriptional regulator [Antrihabitans sp. YC2-6]MBJ8348913.1 TetR/AcrR family transcriptional regulator [Antrihabitans sp. YC2-6]
MTASNNLPSTGHETSRPFGMGSRERLLRAAERCVAVDGASVTMARVAQEAGVTRTVVYRNFSGRDELLIGVLVRCVERLFAETAAAVATCADPGDQVTEAFVYATTAAQREPVIRRLLLPNDSWSVGDLITGAPVLPEQLNALIAGNFQTFLDALRPGLDPADATRYLLGIAFGLFADAIPGLGNPQLVRRYVRTFVLPALLREPPPPEPVFEGS